MKSILFHYSRGAERRVRILELVNSHNTRKKPVFASMLAKKLGVSHVATKKHLDLLIEQNYLAIINSGGKPSYIRLTGKGKSILNEFRK